MSKVPFLLDAFTYCAARVVTEVCGVSLSTSRAQKSAPPWKLEYCLDYRNTNKILVSYMNNAMVGFFHNTKLMP